MFSLCLTRRRVEDNVDDLMLKHNIANLCLIKELVWSSIPQVDDHAKDVYVHIFLLQANE